MGQINGLQVCRQVSGKSPEVIVAKVEHAQVDQCIVDEYGPFQLVVGQIKRSQIPLVDCVILVQQLEAVGGCIKMPEGAWQANGQVAHVVVRQIKESEVGVWSKLAIQVVN